MQVWDIWNEPDNTNDNSYGKDKLEAEPETRQQLVAGAAAARSFAWAREAEPSQPLTSGVWRGRLADPTRS